MTMRRRACHHQCIMDALLPYRTGLNAELAIAMSLSMSAFVQSSLPDYELRRYGALLAVSEAIASHRDLASLLQTLAHQLNQIVQCDLIKVVLYDADRNVMRLHSLQSDISTVQLESLELTPEESPAGQVLLTQRPLLINNLEQLAPYPIVRERILKVGVRSLCML